VPSGSVRPGPRCQYTGPAGARRNQEHLFQTRAGGAHGIVSRRTVLRATGLGVAGCAGVLDDGESSDSTGETDGTPTTAERETGNPTGEEATETTVESAERAPRRTGRHGAAVCERVAAIDGGDVSLPTITDGEMETAVGRYRSRVFDGDPPPASTLRNWLESLTDAGRWPDVDYDDRGRTNWSPATALSRIVDLARAYHTDGHPLGGASEVRAGAVSALEFWLARDPESDNWWWNDIGAPGRMRDVVVLVEDWLTDDQRAAALAVMGRIDPAGEGANLLDTAEVAFLHASGRRRPWCHGGRSRRRVGDSRHQQRRHPGRLQLPPARVGHPAVLLRVGVPRFERRVRGPRPRHRGGLPGGDPRPPRVAPPRGQPLDAAGGYVSPSTLGRSISRTGALRTHLASVCRTLATLADGHGDALREFGSHIEAGAPAESAPVTGHRSYWTPDLAVHHREEFFASVKYISAQTRATESINEENLKGGHLTDGALYVTRRGDEYEDIFPVWDWNHVPGVTAADAEAYRSAGTSPFAGSVSDGQYGVTGFRFFGSAGVGARKAWFFGDRSVTCLGAGITSPRSTDAPVRTTLAQRLLAGAARYGVGDESRTVGPDTVIEDRPVDWLHHDGIGYAFPERTPATVSTRVQEGSWHDINHTEEDDPVSRPVFSSWIDHGVSPDEETYAYVLRPGTDADAMPGVATDPASR
jgi:chondroitin AC lyase